MLILLYGQDDYRRQQKKQEVVESFLKKHSALSVQSFDFEESESYQRFDAFLKGQSLFESAKLAIVDNAFESSEKGIAKRLKEFLEIKNTTILLSSGEKSIPASFKFLLKEPVLFQSFEHLDGVQWKNFIQREATERGVALSEAALHFLATVYHKDSWRLVTELEKMALLGKKEIDRKDLEAFHLEIAQDFFPLLMSLKSSEIKKRISALEYIFAHNEPGAKVFNILAALGGPKLPRLAAYDLAVKSGKLEYDEALLDFVLS